MMNTHVSKLVTENRAKSRLLERFIPRLRRLSVLFSGRNRQFLLDYRQPTTLCGKLAWKAGHITGWMHALIENVPHTFRSFLREERMTVLQEA